MKHTLFATIAFSLMVAAPASAQAPAPAPNPEDAAVRQALDHYLQGHATGDGAHFRLAFHPDARLFWIRDGQVAQRTSEEYAAGASGRPPADESQRKRWIESVDVSGNAAVAKIVLDYPGARFTDYMSLLKVNGEWKIVNKTFHSQPK
jgi:hypothetical protein